MKWPRRSWLDKAGPWAIVILFIEAVILIIWSHRRSHPDIQVPPENRHDFARVAILMDGTRSLHLDTFPLIKRIVREKIIPSLGMNDVGVAYDVHPDFTPAQNAVLGVLGDQLPQDSDDRRAQILDVLERNREAGKHDGDFYDLIRSLPPYRPVVEHVRSVWAERVGKRQGPIPKGSDICSPLRELGGFLRDGDPETERWLFVLSDLKNTGPIQSCHPDDAFPSARIVLIYPFDPANPSWKAIEGFWHGFFGDRKLERKSFLSALTDRALLAPNPTAGLERHEVLTMWECARPWLLPGLGPIALILVIAAFARSHEIPAPESA